MKTDFQRTPLSFAAWNLLELERGWEVVIGFQCRPMVDSPIYPTRVSTRQWAPQFPRLDEWVCKPSVALQFGSASDKWPALCRFWKVRRVADEGLPDLSSNNTRARCSGEQTQQRAASWGEGCGEASGPWLKLQLVKAKTWLSQAPLGRRSSKNRGAVQ